MTGRSATLVDETMLHGMQKDRVRIPLAPPIFVFLFDEKTQTIGSGSRLTCANLSLILLCCMQEAGARLSSAFPADRPAA